MTQHENWHWITDAWRGRTLRATAVLALSTPWLLAWKYFGTIDFYHRAIHPRWPLCPDIFTAAAVYQFLTCFLMLGVIPMLLLKLVFRQQLAEYGLRLGIARRTFFSMLLLAPVFVLIGYFSAGDPALRAVYPLNRSLLDSRLRRQAAAQPSTSAINRTLPTLCTEDAEPADPSYADSRQPQSAAWHWLFALHAVCYFLYYVGWEFYFRGFMLIGLEEGLGRSNALLVQVMASCLLHIGSPATETFGAILGGLLWGLLVFRTRSLLSGLVQHYLLGISLDWFICGSA